MLHHDSPSQFPELQERLYDDIERFQELHGEPRVFRLDNASVNVLCRATSFRVVKGIHTETIYPSESHQVASCTTVSNLPSKYQVLAYYLIFPTSLDA